MFCDRPCTGRRAIKRCIVDDHDVPVPGEMEIELNHVSPEPDRVLESGETVFGYWPRAAEMGGDDRVGAISRWMHACRPHLTASFLVR